MKKKLIIAFIAILACLVILIGIWQISRSRSFQFFGGIVRNVPTQEKVVALTFDDGPTERTDKILKLLKDLDVKATFFLIGDNIEQHPDETRKIIAAGHEIGNHSYSHKRMVLKTPWFIKSELDKTDEIIRKAGYQGPIQFRPPNGKKFIFLPYYLKKQHRKTILWDLEPESYPEIAASSEKIEDYVVNNTQPGSIILLHLMYDKSGKSTAAVRGIVNDLKQKGYKFVTVNELLETGNK